MAGRRTRGMVGGFVTAASAGVVAAGLSAASLASGSVGQVVRAESPERAHPAEAGARQARRSDADLAGRARAGRDATSRDIASRDVDDGPATAGRRSTTSVASVPTTAVPTTTTLPPPPPTPTALPAAAPPVPDPATLPGVGYGDGGELVAVLQARLNELGFRTAADEPGYFGDGTWSAVLALQKFEGLERTGSMDAPTWQRLYAPTGWLPPSRPATGIEVEVDIERQVVIVLNAERPQQVTILNTSTGGEYVYYNRDGSEDYAWTPPGRYEAYRRYDGIEVAPLGTLYRPIYFYRGWAVHGSPSVPAYPASHGCVRLSNNDMDWLWDRSPDDLKVTVRTTMDPPRLAAEEAEWAAAEAQALAEEQAAAEAEAAEQRALAQQAALEAFLAGVDQSRVAAGLEPYLAR